MEKNIQDQIIEGIKDGDTVEDLLQEHNLTLAPSAAVKRQQKSTGQT